MFSILYHTFFIRKIQYFFFSSQNRMPKQTIPLPSDKPFCSGIVETGYARGASVYRSALPRAGCSHPPVQKTSGSSVRTVKHGAKKIRADHSRSRKKSKQKPQKANDRQRSGAQTDIKQHKYHSLLQNSCRSAEPPSA